MGHGSDKLYITHSEHTGEFGQHGASSVGAQRRQHNFAKLPFDCCALTLKPFETPVCTTEGHVYDLLSIIPFIRQHGTDPITGKKLAAGELIKLNFFKNADGLYHDPVTFKLFNEHTHIVAIKSSGNVFARESVDRLNVKPSHWFDLVTDEPFTRKDIITLQDPLNVEGRDLNKADYVKRSLKIDPEEARVGLQSGEARMGVSRVLKTVAETKKDEKTPVINKPVQKKAESIVKVSQDSAIPYNTSLVTSGRTGASFTSTSQPIYTKTENALWDEEDLMFEAIQAKGEKGYARLVTNYGNLNLELYCDRAPRTCYNFLQLARDNKYADTIFHRLIPGFMLQGGDPTGSGRGGQSTWGKPFEDEYNLRNAQKHTDRGTLSMANSGPNTNGSQFFLTFRSTPHLDGKVSQHTVFGRLVGGDDVLSKIERVPIDPATDRPLKPVQLKDVAVFADPYDTYKKRLEKRLTREAEERANAGLKKLKKEERDKDRTTWFGTDLAKGSPSAIEAQAAKAGGVGKYLAGAGAGAGAVKRKEPEGDLAGAVMGGAEKKKKKGGFGDFSGW
ncbi:cyclophilin-like domain-containing protein [Leucosporidium creatinivorum]|uniref:Cyclophilin-like domain-containing protein n=1 Tax=Leucosporidium creatinivorum TaxID=106004 RepID=A0A1Y2F2L2_9BASI|nr:cyclophilin-like domain-containing protein [Leucosporidium creatinivorum]